MTEKEVLLYIIKQKGHCNHIDIDGCNEDCLLNADCLYGDTDKDTYTKAMNRYLRMYGKDIELLEVLM